MFTNEFDSEKMIMLMDRICPPSSHTVKHIDINILAMFVNDNLLTLINWQSKCLDLNISIFQEHLQ